MASDDAKRKRPRARALTVLLGVTVVRGALAATPALASSTSTTAIAADVSQVVDVADPVTEAVTDPVTGLTLGTRTTYATTITLQHENEIQPHPCPDNGELVLFNGKTTLRMTVTFDINGHVRNSSHMESEGHAVGMSSGARYVFSSTNEFTSNGSTATEETTQAAHENYIRTQEVVNRDDFYYHSNFHFMFVHGVPAGGYVDNFRLECR